jgi:glyceraldehyde 3-phosphate dehydrogenase
MKKVKVGINGFGRIGRAFLRQAMEREDVEVVCVNDLGNIENLAYLLKYDTVYKKANFDVQADVLNGYIVLNKNGVESKVKFVSEKDPALIPWGANGAEVVVESTGLFAKYADARAHLKGGTKKVVISAPAKDDPTDMTEGTILMGINSEKLAQSVVTSNASCTTNAASPLIAILDETIGIEKALLSTTHGYTASQGIVDGPNKKDFREGRAAAQNIVPSSTGAAIAVTKAFPSLANKFDGISLRVPVPAGSIVDVTFIAKRETSKEEVNEILKKASLNPRWQNVFSVTEEDLVSSDILGVPFASIADLQFTRVVGGNLVKVLAWYDNESGYTRTLVDHVVNIGQ